MNSQWYNYYYDFDKEFPNLTLVWKRGFESIYAAEKDAQFWLIYSGRLWADLIVVLSLSEEEFDTFTPEMEHPIYTEENWIQIISFETDAERQIYLSEKYPQDALAKYSLAHYYADNK